MGVRFSAAVGMVYCYAARYRRIPDERKGESCDGRRKRRVEMWGEKDNHSRSVCDIACALTCQGNNSSESCV